MVDQVLVSSFSCLGFNSDARLHFRRLSGLRASGRCCHSCCRLRTPIISSYEGSRSEAGIASLSKTNLHQQLTLLAAFLAATISSSSFTSSDFKLIRVGGLRSCEIEKRATVSIQNHTICSTTTVVVEINMYKQLYHFPVPSAMLLGTWFLTQFLIVLGSCKWTSTWPLRRLPKQMA